MISVRAAVWGIAALATGGIMLRPWRLPEAVWAVLGATLLVIFRLLSLGDAFAGVGKGADVYLFLTGMMLLAELARQEGLFDWLAAWAVRHARGSATRLFTLIYGVGVMVTIFLSNDATAVVLTPAVAAVTRTARIREPLPFLFICAFIANAASFVLPISNPANLVLYGDHMPSLWQWLPRYSVASLLSIAATYAALRLTQRGQLREQITADVGIPELSRGGAMAALGITGTAVVLLASSAADLPLGLPTFVAGIITTVLVLTCSTCGPRDVLSGVSWSVLPLVAGLFVLVEALEKTGATVALATLLHDLTRQSAVLAAWTSGLALALGCNLVNNLPAGLIAGRIVELTRVPEQVRAAVLISVDLGPNLSVTGSLATLLWLTALRRDGYRVDAWTFLKLGALVMPPALVLSVASVLR